MRSLVAKMYSSTNIYKQLSGKAAVKCSTWKSITVQAFLPLRCCSNSDQSLRWCNLIEMYVYTVEPRYLELGYLEVCETRSVYLNQKIHFDCFLQP